MRRLLFLAFIVFGFCQQSFAQGKMTEGLREFMQTEFMQQYNDLKIKAESDMRAFMKNAHQYNPQDVARVQTAYNQTARRFNFMLEDIKQDFLDRKKLKFISEYPDTYSQGLELKIRELSDFYAQNLQQTLADVTNNQQDGSALLLLLVDLVKYATDAVSHISQIRRESSRYTNQYLDNEFVNPNRFPSYDELNRGGNSYSDPYNNNTTSDPYNSNPYNTSDPYNNNTTSDPYNSNPYNTSDPYNNNTSDPYNTTSDPYGNNTSNPYSDNPYDGTSRTQADSLKQYLPKQDDASKDKIQFKPAPKDTNKTDKKTTENKKQEQSPQKKN